MQVQWHRRTQHQEREHSHFHKLLGVIYQYIKPPRKLLLCSHHALQR
jgi:hypothetical protein